MPKQIHSTEKAGFDFKWSLHGSEIFVNVTRDGKEIGEYAYPKMPQIIVQAEFWTEQVIAEHLKDK